MTTATATVPVAFSAAATPVSDLAKALAAEAQAKRAAPKKQGGLKDMADSRPERFMINPYLITVKDGFNARDFNDPAVQEHVDAIARDMAQNGFLTEKSLVVVWENEAPRLTDGECRLRAVLRAIEVYGAPIKSIPVVTEAKGTSEAEQIINQLRRNGGDEGVAGQKRFTPFEMATLFKKLRSFGWTDAQIGTKVGLSASRVGQIVDFDAAPEEVKALVREGKVTHTLARNVLADAKGDGVKAISVLTDAVKVAEVRGKARATGKDVAKAGGRQTSGSKMQAVRAILAAADIDESLRGKAALTISKADLAKLREIVGF